MDISDYINKLKQRKQAFQKNIVKLCADSAFTVAALSKSRVINERIDEEGNIFGIYSEEYQETRKKKNLTGEQINFSFSNQMWTTTIPRLESSTDKKIVFVIKPSKANEEKMKYQSERFGNIVALSQEEIEKHNKTLSENINSVIIKQ